VTPDELRDRRKALGLSQSGLGRALGISPNTVARWERGEQRLGNPALVRLALDGLARADAAPGAADRRSAKLPATMSSLIGRHAEIRMLRRLCARRRLVTLTGTAGVGKTRLALEVASQLAARHGDRTVLVELAPLSEPAQVVRTVAACVQVREQPGQPLIETLAGALETEHARLVLDNCEHLVEACAEVVERLLRGCPHVQILAASREALGVDGELVFSVPPLGLPTHDAPTLDQLRQCEALALFVERARSVQPGFELSTAIASTVADICRKLDGLPLALELAAAQIRVLSPAELLERLSDPFRLLRVARPGSPPHQQGLEATLDWSCALLSESERQLFERLSIFAGGFTLEAVEAVCAVDTLPRLDMLPLLRRLVESSLVVVDRADGLRTRYRLLETLREYAGERLRARGETRQLAMRHCDWCVALVERFDVEWRGPGQAAWFDRMEQEHANALAALRWCIATEELERGLRLAGSVWRFWEVHGYLSEGRRWLMRLLDGDGPGTPARARALDAAGHLAILQGDEASGIPLIEKSLALANSFGDECTRSSAYHSLGLAAQYRLEYRGAEVMHAASLQLARRIKDTRREYVALYNLAVVAQKQSQFEQATALHEDSLALKRQVGDQWSIGYSLFNLGLLAWIRGEPDRASTLVCASLDLRHQLGDKPGVAACLETLAEFDTYQRRWLRAARLFGTTDALLQATGVRIFTPRECGLSRDLEAVRAQLGGATFTRAYAGGRATPLTLVVAEMLGKRSIGTASRGRSAHMLTPREHEVAVLVADGLSNRQIAARLAIAEGTAQRHMANIMAKLGAVSRAEVAAWNARQSANSGAVQVPRTAAAGTSA
jgi:non-specific serine/threonine protein kinase